ncbi:MAG TPA: heavy-metal-associated domain-containing protein [Candidatus Methylomirabilis sp.]|nr:heavy-metal-associated domain-containing protein [Candidatus Methylomirabilis sp.]
MGHYIHHVPGRLRIRTPLLKRDEKGALAAEQFLRLIEGVTSVRANAVTGSITLTYERDTVSSEAILNAAARRGYYRPDAVRHADGQLHDAATRAGDTLGKVLFGLVVEKAFERSAVALIGALL